MITIISGIILLSKLLTLQGDTWHFNRANPATELAKHSMSLENRYPVKSVNTVFKENILLTLDYLSGKTTSKNTISWSNIDRPFEYDMQLDPGQTFAFHDQSLPYYHAAQTTNAHFDATEGFLSDGYLYGDGVCHLASIMYWTAKDAGLQALAPTNHNFANIPEIPKQYGVAIYTNKNDASESEKENLYITNSLDKPVVFAFNYDGKTLAVSVQTSPNQQP